MIAENEVTIGIKCLLLKNFKYFGDVALKRFGSGWAWLVKTAEGKLAIGSTPNQDNPLMDISDFKGEPLFFVLINLAGPPCLLDANFEIWLRNLINKLIGRPLFRKRLEIISLKSWVQIVVAFRPVISQAVLRELTLLTH